MSSLYKPSNLLDFLNTNTLKVSKNLSQHFLIDGNIIRKILQTANVSSDDRVIEIGPGPGALTEALLQTKAHVIAIEKDKKYASLLNRLQTSDNRLQVYEEDFLDFPLEKILLEGKKVKIVANLPYQISSLILQKLLPLFSKISSMTFMVQKEFAQRMIAKKNSANYSHLSLLTQFYSSPSYAFTVKPNCFFPVPKVDSAVVHLSSNQSNELKICAEDFFTLTRLAFTQRRKTLRNSLKTLISLDILDRVLPKNLRPEELSIEEWIELSKKLLSEGLQRTVSCKQTQCCF